MSLPAHGFLSDVVEGHAETAGLLRRHRARTAVSRTHGLGDLARMDERIDANVDALVLCAAEDARAIEVARVLGGGSFVEASVALGLGRIDALHECVAGATTASRERDVVAALARAPFDRARDAARELARRDGDGRRAALWITVSRVHRRDPGAALGDALDAEDPRVRAEAARAAGELGRDDLAGRIARAQGDADPACAAWSAWAAARFGERRAIEALSRVARDAASPAADRALALALRRLAPDAAAALLRAVAAEGGERRAVEAAGVLGDPRDLPWLFALAERAELARSAGWAVATIAGVDVARDRLAAQPPEGFRSGPSDSPLEHDVGMDPDARLPWPDLARLRAIVGDRAAELVPGARRVRGRPIDRDALAAALLDGSQAVRASAALDLAIDRPSEPLFEARDRADRQTRRLTERDDVAPR